MAPIVHGIEAEYWNRVDFIYLDRERSANRNIVDQFGVRSQPVFVLLDSNGEVVDQWYGGVGSEDIRIALDELAASG